MGIPRENKVGKTILYARVSNQSLKKCGVEIVVVHNETLSPQEELFQDLISIIHVFSCRIYGLRKYKKIERR